jgi:ribosomal-protein-alanine N-acetyltransferase
MFRVITDPLVSRYFGKKLPAAVDEMRRKIADSDEALRDAKQIRWALVERETGAYLGGASIWRWDKSHFRAEVGYEIASSHWGRGLVPEALEAVVRFGFERMGLHSMEGRTHPENRASARVLEKLGFVREGYFRESYYNDRDNKFEDTAVYSLLAREGPAATGSGFSR